MAEDINQKIMQQLDNVSSELPSIQNNNDDSDDDFEKLLNDFIFAEKNGEPQAKQTKEENISHNQKSSEAAAGQNENQDSQVPEVSKEPAIVYEPDENELVQAYQNFISSISEIAASHGLKMPDLVFEPERLVPNYKPSLGWRINEDTTHGWDIMLQSFPDEISSLSPNSSDEEFLNFAERQKDPDLQLAIISYVEILIDIENCEISYEERRLKAQRRRIERAIYEEYQKRRERKQRFIDALKKQNFPIDAERLINNYFKTANKDPKGAFDMLVANPAVYAPIEVDKIKPRMFGLIKPTPEDGIRENHRIGLFLKHLKA